MGISYQLCNNYLLSLTTLLYSSRINAYVIKFSIMLTTSESFKFQFLLYVNLPRLNFVPEIIFGYLFSNENDKKDYSIIEQTIQSLEIDSLSPIQAFSVLYDLKEKLKDI